MRKLIFGISALSSAAFVACSARAPTANGQSLRPSDCKPAKKVAASDLLRGDVRGGAGHAKHLPLAVEQIEP